MVEEKGDRKGGDQDVVGRCGGIADVVDSMKVIGGHRQTVDNDTCPVRTLPTFTALLRFVHGRYIRLSSGTPLSCPAKAMAPVISKRKQGKRNLSLRVSSSRPDRTVSFPHAVYMGDVLTKSSA